MNMQDKIKEQNKHKKVILLNGPPGSGKDLSAIIIYNCLNGRYKEKELIPYRTRIMKFADPIKAAAHALYNVPYSCDFYEREFGREWKDQPQVEFYGKTPREEYIALSETFAKHRHGEAVFGRVAARRIALEKQANVFIFSDSGFASEAIPVISLVGIENVIVFELSRNGNTFDGDSRSYISTQLNAAFANKLKVQAIPNHGDKDDLRLILHGALVKHFGIEYVF